MSILYMSLVITMSCTVNCTKLFKYEEAMTCLVDELAVIRSNANEKECALLCDLSSECRLFQIYQGACHLYSVVQSYSYTSLLHENCSSKANYFVDATLDLPRLNLTESTTTEESSTTTVAMVHPDCASIKASYPSSSSGVYSITVQGETMDVFCDMNTDSEQWIVFQYRFDGSVSFGRTWADYKSGFGQLNGEFWLGLDNIHVLSDSAPMKLRIDMERYGTKVYVDYDTFHVAGETDKYRLTLKSHSGTVPDSANMIANNKIMDGKQFTTYDQDNDNFPTSCSIDEGSNGGWWYADCGYVRLNGDYNQNNRFGLVWYHWSNSWDTISMTRMKIKFK